MLKITIDTRNMNRAIAAISRFSGVAHEEVIEEEAGKILEAAVRLTPAAKMQKIKAHYASLGNSWVTESPELYTPVSPSGISHRAKVKVTKTGKIRYDMSHRYPDALWAAITGERKTRLEAALRARGLSKNAWLMLGQAAGITVKAPGYVKQAIPSTGKVHPENATARKTRPSGRYGIFFETIQPTLITIGGHRILQRAINGRVKYFERNLKLGVFKDLKKIAARYPGLTIA